MMDKEDTVGDSEMWEWFERKFDLDKMQEEVDLKEKNDGLFEWEPTVIGMFGEESEIEVVVVDTKGNLVGYATEVHKVPGDEDKWREYSEKVDIVDYAESLIN